MDSIKSHALDGKFVIVGPHADAMSKSQQAEV